jgi:nicotinamidase-related amidase
MAYKPVDKTSDVALLLIDFINPMNFEGAEALVDAATTASAVALRLRKEADRLKIPTIYVNDNHGHWRSERSWIVENCARAGDAARRLVRRIAPRARDYFVIKPHLSGFYATSLPVLLPKLGVNRIVLTGVATDICVLFTAADAHMRDYDLWIPSDAVASESQERRDWALDIMHKSMNAEVRPSTVLALDSWASTVRRRQAPTVAQRS